MPRKEGRLYVEFENSRVTLERLSKGPKLHKELLGTDAMGVERWENLKEDANLDALIMNLVLRVVELEDQIPKPEPTLVRCLECGNMVADNDLAIGHSTGCAAAQEWRTRLPLDMLRAKQALGKAREFLVSDYETVDKGGKPVGLAGALVSVIDELLEK